MPQGLRLSDDAFFAPIEAGLRACPELCALIPAGYPRTGSARLDPQVEQDHDPERTKFFEHGYTLPIALYLAGNPRAKPNARAFAAQTLGDLEAFAALFKGKPGLQQVLRVLWTSGRTPKDPYFWSVVAHCKIACALQNAAGREVTGFERPTGLGDCTADIAFTLEGREALLDIVMWHDARGASAADLRSFARANAKKKAKKKFPDFAGDRIGVVVLVALAQGDSFKLLLENPDLRSPFALDEPQGCCGQLAMIRGSGDANGHTNGYAMFLNKEDPL